MAQSHAAVIASLRVIRHNARQLTGAGRTIAAILRRPTASDTERRTRTDTETDRQTDTRPPANAADTGALQNVAFWLIHTSSAT